MYKATASDLQCFKDWLSQVPYLPQDYSDHVIQWFIEGSKGRMEQAKNKFDSFHRIRMENPDVMTGIDIEDPVFYNHVTEHCHMAIPETITKTGSIVLYCFPQPTDTDLEKVKQFYKDIVFNALVTIHDPYFLKRIEEKWNGKVCLVTDMSNVTAAQMLLSSTPGLLKGMFELLYSFPVGVDSIHYINASPVFDKLIDIVKALAKKKISERIHTHRSSASLVDLIGLDALTSDYGGNLPSIKELSQKYIEWAKEKRDDYMKWDAKLADLEKLRPKNAEGVIVGTFKKLEVD